MTGLYIHIPFCASRCVYCGFYSTTLPALRDAYVDALCQELPLRAEELPADKGALDCTIRARGTAAAVRATGKDVWED